VDVQLLNQQNAQNGFCFEMRKWRKLMLLFWLTVLLWADA